MPRRLIAVLATAGLSLTLAAAPARASSCMEFEKGTTKAKMCPAPSWANAKKKSLKIRANGKKTLTYKKGKSRTYKQTLEFRGFGETGTCRFRPIMVVKSGGKKSTERFPWMKVPCLGLAAKMTIAKLPISTGDLDSSVIPVTVTVWYQVKPPSGKVVSSNEMTLKILSTYKAP